MGTELQSLSSGCLTQGPLVTFPHLLASGCRGSGLVCLEPFPGSNWTLGSTVEGFLSGVEGEQGAGGLTQEVQGHYMTTDRCHLEADWLASKGSGVLMH